MTTFHPDLKDEKRAEIEAAERLFEGKSRQAVLLGYQASTVADLLAGTAVVVVEKSRRIGLTWAIAAFAVMRAAAAPSAGGDHVFYMGYEKDMAIEFIEACAMWARAFKIVADDVDEEIIDDLDEDGRSKNIQSYRIKFASGFRIVALPSVPRAFRGKQGVVILDEAAFHNAIAEKIKAALALLMWGGQVIVISTHDGVANPFNQLVEKMRAGKQPGRLIRITFDDAIEDGLYERMQEVFAIRGKAILPKAEFIADIRGFYGENAAEELDVIPSVGAGSLINLQHLAACEDDHAGKPELYAGGLYFIGRDVARRRDGQIQWGFELVGDTLVLRDRWEEVGKSFDEQDAFFNWMMRHRRVVQAGIDQGGMGEKVVEDLQRLHGSYRVQGFLLQGATRIDLAMSLATRVERVRIRIPYDPKIRDDFLAIKKVSGAGSAIRIVNAEDEVHSDRFWAGAIASLLGDFPTPEFDYHPVNRTGDSPRDRHADFMRPDHDDDFQPSWRGRRGF
jgi:phage FluMu gp28-like protein